MIVEIIRIRSSQKALMDSLPSLIAQIEEMKGALIGMDVLLVEHSRYEGDYAVFIIWDTKKTNWKNREGFMIADKLQEIGLVSHEVWMDDFINERLETVENL